MQACRSVCVGITNIEHTELTGALHYPQAALTKALEDREQRFNEEIRLLRNEHAQRERELQVRFSLHPFLFQNMFLCALNGGLCYQSMS